MDGVDYEFIARYCEFPITCPPEMSRYFNGEELCSEPALYRVWWGDQDEMYVCEEHLQRILTVEEDMTDGT